MKALHYARLACLTLACAAPATAADCPWPLTMWAVTEPTPEEGLWTLDHLEVLNGIVRYRHLEVWLAVPELPAEDRRWFVRDAPGPVPRFLTVSSRQGSFSEFEALCDALNAAGDLQSVVGEACDDGRAADDARWTLTDRGRNYGVIAAARGDDERCPRDPRRARALSSLVIEAAPDDPVIAAWQGFLTTRRRVRPAPSGPPFLPAAGSLIDSMMDHDSASVPEVLRSDMQLAFAAGTMREYAVALALGALDRPDARADLEEALLFLGERPTPEARDSLLLLLRRSTLPDEASALALRALVGADPAAARSEALRLLEASEEVSPAVLGVFALTEPGVAKKLNRLDLEDAEAVEAARDALLERLAAPPSDPEN